MSSITATKQARAADTTTFPLAFTDPSGNGSGPFIPQHAIVDANGNPASPALEAGGNLATTAAGVTSSVAALGGPGDSTYNGSGNASVIAVLKGLFSQQTGTLKVQTQTPTTFKTKRVVMTGSPIQLDPFTLLNGIIITAPGGNVGNVYYGPTSASVLTIDGTGDAYPILPGTSVTESITNSNAVWINGTSGDAINWKGN